MRCRFCQRGLEHILLDLGNFPPANSFFREEELDKPETYYPLKAFICDNCFLVQVEEYKKHNEIFNSDYPYFSSYSKYWLDHSQRYAQMAVSRFGLNNDSLVVEVASNDGYLLQYFRQGGIPVLGIEPASNTARIAREKGIESLEEFFGEALAARLKEQGRIADLLVGNNVLAHVPDINDFIRGFKILLKEHGVITMEFPHLMNLIQGVQFDTIYHEHFSYFSFCTSRNIFEHHNLEVFDVEELPTHGGSLRIYAKHREDSARQVAPSVERMIKKEEGMGMFSLDYYKNFKEKVEMVKYNLLEFLIAQKKNKRSVVGYGAAAKGNTLLNYCGIKSDLIPYVADIIPWKQGKYLPGSHIPVVHEGLIRATRPDFILILPWNHKDEIVKRLDYTKEWDSQFIIPAPYLDVL